MVCLADNASSPHHNPQSQIAHSGDIFKMSATQSAFLKAKMAHMMQEMDSKLKLEFSRDDDSQEQNTFEFEPKMYNDDTSEDDMPAITRSQTLSAEFTRPTIEEHVSSSRSVLIHGSSSTAVRADKSPSHIIQGDHIEVDNDGPPSLTMEERVSSSSRSVLFQESSSTAVRTDKSPSHIIQGDHTEVDNDGTPSPTMEERVSSSSRSVLFQESSSTAVRADKSPSHIIQGDHIEVGNDGSPSLTINHHQKKGRKKIHGPRHRTSQFHGCNVYMNSFNARGVRFKNSANYAPRVTRLSCFLLYFSHMTDPYC